MDIRARTVLAQDELVAALIAELARVGLEGVGFGFAKDGEGVAAAGAVALGIFAGGVSGGTEPDRRAEEGFDTGGVDGDDGDELGSLISSGTYFGGI